MNTQELNDLLTRIALSQEKTDQQLKETDRYLKETDRQLRETDQRLRETDLQIAELRLAQRETTLQIGELRLAQQETDRQLKETDRQLRRQLRELGAQIGGLGRKFGGFTEGMAFPSMSKILTEQFGMEVVTPRFKVQKAGETLELDVLAYANSTRNAAFVVEVKSHLRPEGIEQLREILQNFRRFLPEHRDKTLYGMLAVVDAAEDVRREALSKGFYLAGIHGEQFIMQTPPGFVAKGW